MPARHPLSLGDRSMAHAERCSQRRVIVRTTGSLSFYGTNGDQGLVPASVRRSQSTHSVGNVWFQTIARKQHVLDQRVRGMTRYTLQESSTVERHSALLDDVVDVSGVRHAFRSPCLTATSYKDVMNE
ncbi:hypothetical protein L210DRAFT_3505310 [Boletus edulis BED1]|uniref:Uncharacterized protein n=1 Tax=Boletus edulis BED1 TaxID=1328754 RepID=A0AAD4GDX7_BOLED|nr:hypothetical protein L210DRAFT_3505310 [Boletus edulis BED1]